ncbi:MAG: GAF domain-containing protein [Desulfobacteraceae bacterium]|jgi:signal transduction histidine kinase|nr:MAG: GAF domain-containing protein [Desulfobacteraceae bacterium]
MLLDRRYISVELTRSDIEQRNRALSTVLEMSNYLAGINDIDLLLDGALSRVMEAFEYDAGRIYLMDERGEGLLLAAHRGMEAAGLEKVNLDEGFTGKAARTRSFLAQYVTDLEDKKRAERLAAMGFKVIICVPLVTWDRVDGVMNLASSRVVSLDHGKIDLLVTVGNQIAVAVHNARLYKELQGRLAMLKEKKDMIQFVAYSISHDLKSPATGLYGLTKRLWEKNAGQLDDKGRECCELILKTADYMLQLVERLNSYVSAKEGTLRPELVNVLEIIDSVKGGIEHEITKRGIRWLQPESFPRIVADRISFARVIRNLVDNALKYGGPSLSEIAVEYCENDDFHIFSVTDDGAGISLELAEKIFEPFHRDPSSRGVAGSGLGMAIVKEIAERHGGKAWVDTSRPKGARISMSISKTLVADQVINSNNR